MKLLGIISLGFDTIDKLPIRFYAFADAGENKTGLEFKKAYD
jgi:hypothetical protein